MRTTAQTGVEMEALTAVAVAALTIYDMVKAVDKAMVIGDIRLIEEDRRPQRHLASIAMNVLVAIYSPCRSWNIPDANVERLRARVSGSHVRARRPADAERWPRIADVDVAFSSQITAGSTLAAAERLRWIHSPAAGVGSMLFPEMVASADRDDQLPRHQRGHHRRARDRGDAGAAAQPAARLAAPGERDWAQDEFDSGRADRPPCAASGS